MESAQYTDTGPALHDLEAVSGGIEQLPIDQDRPAFPCSVRFPALSDSTMAPVSTYLNPVIWIRSVFLYAAIIRRPRWHLNEVLNRDYLDIPAHASEIDSTVVAQEVGVISVVVEKLLNDILGPPQRADLGVRAEFFKAAVLAIRHRQVREVCKFHDTHRRVRRPLQRGGCVKQDLGHMDLRTDRMDTATLIGQRSFLSARPTGSGVRSFGISPAPHLPWPGAPRARRALFRCQS